MSTEPSGQSPTLMEELKAKNALVLARLGDVPYFSDPWITAVEDTLSLARKLVRNSHENQTLDK